MFRGWSLLFACCWFVCSVEFFWAEPNNTSVVLFDDPVSCVDGLVVSVLPVSECGGLFVVVAVFFGGNFEVVADEVDDFLFVAARPLDGGGGGGSCLVLGHWGSPSRKAISFRVFHAAHSRGPMAELLAMCVICSSVRPILLRVCWCCCWSSSTVACVIVVGIFCGVFLV